MQYIDNQYYGNTFIKLTHHQYQSRIKCVILFQNFIRLQPIMKRLTALIIDDERLARLNLRKKLNMFSEIEVIGEASV